MAWRTVPSRRLRLVCTLSAPSASLHTCFSFLSIRWVPVPFFESQFELPLHMSSWAAAVLHERPQLSAGASLVELVLCFCRSASLAKEGAHLSLTLEVEDASSLPVGWSRSLTFRATVLTASGVELGNGEN